MSSQNTNPFVLPGFGQDGITAGNPLISSMEMMGKAWQAFAQTGTPSTFPMASTSLNPEELDKRIQELKTVENWLKLNLSMLSSTIQGMEIQRASIATMHSFVSAVAEQHKGQATLDEVLGIKPKAAEAPSPSEPDTTASSSDAMGAAANVWWDMLQNQFNQLAQATAATMQASTEATPEAESGESTKPAAAPAKTSARKTAAKKTTTPAKK
ncbi:MAG: hypothetical protein RBR67_14600 [Desulfobacterium sp.]|nr:hypothetical protein [Desulfobacterium sp.]